MLKTVSQSFAPLTVDTEASLGPLLEELRGLLRSGLRLDICVRATSAVCGGGSAAVRCMDCGVPGHASRRYGGCKFFQRVSMPRSGSPPRQVGRRLPKEDIGCSPMMSPPTSKSTPSSDASLSGLLRVPKPFTATPKPRRRLTPPPARDSPPPPRPTTPPATRPPSVAPAVASTPSAAAPLPSEMHTPPVGTPSPFRSPIDEEHLIPSDESPTYLDPVREELLERIRHLRDRCRRYFANNQMCGPLVDDWEEVLTRDVQKEDKEDFLAIAELMELWPDPSNGDLWRPWDEKINAIMDAINGIARANPELKQEVTRRRRLVLSWT